MPDINNEDVEACRRARDSESPTEILLTIWGSKGNKVIQLYNLLARTRLVRAMEVIRHLVDSKYHQWEDECVRSRTTVRSATPKGSSESFRNQGHGWNATRLSEQHSYQNASVASSKPPQNISSASAANSATSEPSGLFMGLQNTPPVRYEEIIIATENFAAENILGRGGYGVVYKGNWKHTQHEKERLRQSLQELRTLAKYRHDNILPLYGYSLDGPEPCLVYQFMANGSLEDRILCRKGTPPLTWSQKRNIAEGSARGLHFLHSIGRTPIIHGDVKTANILLDKHLEPKLGDFGLCRDGQVETGPGEKTPLIASHIKGTLAYLPPEFITSKILTTKLDVYSFGVVLLEIGTGLRAYVDSRQPHSLVDYVTHVQAQVGSDSKTLLEALADRRCPPTDRLGVWSGTGVKLPELVSELLPSFFFQRMGLKPGPAIVEVEPGPGSSRYRSRNQFISQADAGAQIFIPFAAWSNIEHICWGVTSLVTLH
ncbi:Serine/threonine-protein kinase pelle [Toxocara canis]|uniref:non-specific serine/threonine protein kinase n=1 Tax=Toxocara canis TaxID=6265 RepID=A0A0B2VFU2_TOXCA|nr:Serine/threonine-protein kinase pelle [Toxocara canis]